jgi:hypothetical protein
VENNEKLHGLYFFTKCLLIMVILVTNVLSLTIAVRHSNRLMRLTRRLEIRTVTERMFPKQKRMRVCFFKQAHSASHFE